MLTFFSLQDDPINRAIIKRRLAKEGHEVHLAVHGEEAIRAFEADKTFEIILMDLQMPICDGLEATKRIRAIEDAVRSGKGKGKEVSPGPADRDVKRKDFEGEGGIEGGAVHTDTKDPNLGSLLASGGLDPGSSVAASYGGSNAADAHMPELPETHQVNGRIPILAVSASLSENQRQEITDVGLDGWILKPVDFKRLSRTCPSPLVVS